MERKESAYKAASATSLIVAHAVPIIHAIVLQPIQTTDKSLTLTLTLYAIDAVPKVGTNVLHGTQKVLQSRRWLRQSTHYVFAISKHCVPQRRLWHRRRLCRSR